MTSELETRIWDQPWPKGGLEAVSQCPVCGSSHRKVLHSQLIDNVFFCAPGKWTLFSCRDCGSAYLDPRPTPETIGLAYSSYFTHAQQENSVPFSNLQRLRKLKRLLANGYRKREYQPHLEEPSSEWGYFLVKLLPFLGYPIDQEYRHLKFPNYSSTPTLLDIGCGSGLFLRKMQQSGWQAVGVEPDPKAVARARSLGIEVYEGGVEVFQGKEALFDAITLSHVIEHVHEPVSVLESCYRLLKPNGTLWLETPNIDALGHKIYQENWRGLEPPRHLVLFSLQSLTRLLKKLGYRNIKLLERKSPAADLFLKSYLMSSHKSPYSSSEVSPLSVKLLSLAADIVSSFAMNCKEFITLSASK